MTSLQKESYNHAEAFAIMRYRCEDCGLEIAIWNSRDGVTPFTIGCRARCGGTMLHVHWSHDRRDPEYMPHMGEYVFIDMPQEVKLVIARMRVEASKGTEFYPDTPEQHAELIKGIAESFQEGEPFLIAWPT